MINALFYLTIGLHTLAAALKSPVQFNADYLLQINILINFISYSFHALNNFFKTPDFNVS